MAYRRFWALHPPTDLLVAGYLGYKGTDIGAPTKQLPPQETKAKVEDLVEKLAGMMGVELPK